MIIIFADTQKNTLSRPQYVEISAHKNRRTPTIKHNKR